jgi:uncharacterized protein (TIGR03067 family)
LSRLVPVIAAALCLWAGSAVCADEAADMKLLTGAWEVTSLEAFGQRVPVGQPGAPDKVVFKDGNATFFAQGKGMEKNIDLRVGLDASKNPKIMDFVRSTKVGKESLPCLYEVSAEQLRLAMPMVPADKRPEDPLARPESFDTKGKPVVVLTAKRMKE